jgi:hypothetical protein
VIVRFLTVAEAELEEAMAYYEERESGLGLRFLSEIRNAVDRIVAYPNAWFRLSESTYRCRTNIFPYGIVFQIRDKEILIVAIASFHREPYYWKDRL